MFPVIGVLLMTIFASVLLSNPCWGNDKSQDESKSDRKRRRIRFHDVTEQMIQPLIAPVLQQENNDVVDAVKKEYNDLPQHQPVSSLVANLSGLNIQSCAVNLVGAPEVVDKGVSPIVSPQLTGRQSQRRHSVACESQSGIENANRSHTDSGSSQMSRDSLEQSFRPHAEVSENDINVHRRLDSEEGRPLTSSSGIASYSQHSFEVDSLDVTNRNRRSDRRSYSTNGAVSPATSVHAEPTSSYADQQMLDQQEEKNVNEQRDSSKTPNRNLILAKWLSDVENSRKNKSWTKEKSAENCVKVKPRLSDQNSSYGSQPNITSSTTENFTEEVNSQNNIKKYRRKTRMLKRQEKLSLLRMRQPCDTTSTSGSDSEQRRGQVQTVEGTCVHGTRCQSRCRKRMKRKNRYQPNHGADCSLYIEGNREGHKPSKSFSEAGDTRDDGNGICGQGGDLLSNNRGACTFHTRGQQRKVDCVLGGHPTFVQRDGVGICLDEISQNKKKYLDASERGASILGQSGVVVISDMPEESCSRGASMFGESDITSGVKCCNSDNPRGASTLGDCTIKDDSPSGLRADFSLDIGREKMFDRGKTQGSCAEDTQIRGASSFGNDSHEIKRGASEMRGASSFGIPTKRPTGVPHANSLGEDALVADTSSVTLSMAFESDFTKGEKYSSGVSSRMVRHYKNATCEKQNTNLRHHSDDSKAFEEIPVRSSTPYPSESGPLNSSFVKPLKIIAKNTNETEFQPTPEVAETVKTNHRGGLKFSFDDSKKASYSNPCDSCNPMAESTQALGNVCTSTRNLQNETEVAKLIDNVKINDVDSQNCERGTTSYLSFSCNATQGFVGHGYRDIIDKKNFSDKKLHVGLSRPNEEELVENNNYLEITKIETEKNGAGTIYETETKSYNSNTVNRAFKPGADSALMQGLLSALKKDSLAKKCKKTKLLQDKGYLVVPDKNLVSSVHTVVNMDGKFQLDFKSEVGDNSSSSSNKHVLSNGAIGDGFQEKHTEKQQRTEDLLITKKDNGFGKLTFSLIYNYIDDSHSLLYVSIIKLKDLPPESFDTLRGVQVKFSVFPKGSAWRYTKSIKGESRNPQFNDLFIVSSITPDCLLKSVIKFAAVSCEMHIGELEVPLVGLYSRKKIKKTMALMQPDIN